MAKKQEHIDRLQAAIQQMHKCGADHRETVLVHEVYQGKIWQGAVEVFDLTGHPKANRCYAWSHGEGQDDQGERFVAVLEIAPVDSAQSAVQVQIVKDAKENKK